jgi:outer membrane lipoprotein-sorting protein
MRNNDLWLYLPSVKRATRISLQQRLTGEVSNGDLARSNLFEDYVPKSIKSQKMGNLPCYVLDLKAKSKIATYRRIQLWIQQSDSRPVRADFYALSGKILKSSEYSEFEEVLGLPRATKVVIRDALDPKRESHLKYSDFKRESLDESFFSKDGLQ